MKKTLLTAATTLMLTACTSIQVDPVASNLNIDKICIEENPKVMSGTS